MNIMEKAIKLHDEGYNCAQSVLGACSEYTGLDEKTALAVSGGLGGGVRCGEVCGSVTSAVMALGLANPFNSADDVEAKKKIAELTKTFVKRFKEEYGCVRCLDLNRKGYSCDELIKFSARLAEEMILNNK